MKHFSVYELVDPKVYSIHGDKAISCMDGRLLTFLDDFHDFLSEKFPGKKASIKVNDYKWGGKLSNRGLRSIAYYGFGPDWDNSRSQHKYGRAADFDVYIEGVRMSPTEVRQLIIDNHDKGSFRHITFIEDGVNWAHVDVRATPNGDLQVWHVDTKQVTVYGRS